MSYEQLLYSWRFAPVGDLRFQGESGEYWAQRMAILRNDPSVDTVAASKRVGWE